MKRQKTIKQTLEFLDSIYLFNKIAIVMTDDNGYDHLIVGPIKFEDLKYSDIKDILDERVYSITIEDTFTTEYANIDETIDEDNKDSRQEFYLQISYEDPQGEWK